MQKYDKCVCVSVGRTDADIKARTSEYIAGKWFCCDDKKGQSITAEFILSCFVKACVPRGWQVECVQLDSDPSGEAFYWQQLQPLLQRRRDGRRAQFSEELKLRGRAGDAGFENWYSQGAYGDKDDGSIRTRAHDLLQPMIAQLIRDFDL